MTGRRRFPMGPYWLVLALLFALAMAPIALSVMTGQTAERLGCTITDGIVAPCLDNGVDRTAELQTGLGALWYVLITWPAAILGTVVWLGVLVLHRGRFREEAASHG